MPYVLASWPRSDAGVDALVVEDAVYCGCCTPHASPIRLDLLLGGQE